jgi:hypothetical protein
MAVRIPLVVDYNGKGLDRLKREFAQLDGIAAKSKFALQKAFLPATAVLGGLAVAATDAAKAALEDQQAQEILAKVLRETTKATDQQIASVEDWISAQGRLYGVADDDLRPAYAKLIRVTKDNTKAQKFAALAMDVSAGTGKDLNEVTDAFSKALGGNLRGIRGLAPELQTLIKEGASAEDVMAALADTFGGAAATKADTAAGRMEILQLRFAELREEIGAKLLPIIEKYILPAFEKITTWAEENPDKIKVIAAAFGILAASIVGVNIAMMLNPAVLIVAGILALSGALYLAYQRSESFRNMLKSIWEWCQKIIGAADRLFKALAPLNTITGRFGQGSGIGGFARRLLPDPTPFFDIPGVPFLADGGIVTRPTLSVIGEAGAEAVIPLNQLGDMTRGSSTTNVTINVSGGDPRAVVDALVRWSRQNGALPSTIRTR